MSPHSILFLGKKDDMLCNFALSFCRQNFKNVKAFLGEWGDPLPTQVQDWEGDYIVSYLSRWIIPKQVLDNAKLAAINFHPGSSHYPGFGCVNFALYENALRYGVVCHHMATLIDSGPIVKESTFPVYDTDNVESLLNRSHVYLLRLFFEVVDGILQNHDLTNSEASWTRSPFTRKDFEEINYVESSMSDIEISRRIRATRFREHEPKKL